jgi:heme exporter protein CcmD
MNHAVFIWSAYGATAVILLWTAIAPVLKQKQAMNLISLLASRERNNDSDT